MLTLKKEKIDYLQTFINISIRKRDILDWRWKQLVIQQYYNVSKPCETNMH